MTDLRPVVGSDRNTWGTKLLSWLGVSVNTDGTLKGSAVQSALGGSISAHETGSGHDPVYPLVYNGTTYRRGIVVLRFDDCNAKDYTTVKGLLDSRLLPGGFAIVGNWMDTTGFLTTAQALEMQAGGHEIMCHSRNHADPTLQPSGQQASYFVDETETVAGEMRADGFYINSWVQPGVYTGSWSLDSAAKAEAWLGSYTIDEMFRKNFGAAEAYIDDGLGGINGARPLPWQYRYLYRAPYQILTGKTLADAEAYVDAVNDYGGIIELLFHPLHLDEVGEMTTAQFTTLLDYIQTRRDEGVLDVLTPTAARYAVKAAYKPNLIVDPGFEHATPGNFPSSLGSTGQGWYESSGTPVAVTGQGRDGGMAAKVPSGSVLRQRVLGAKLTRSIRVDAWAKASSGTVTAEILIDGMQSGNSTPVVTKTVDTSVGTTHTQCSAMVGAHPNVDYWRISLQVNGAGTVYYDDVSMVKQ